MKIEFWHQNCQNLVLPAYEISAPKSEKPECCIVKRKKNRKQRLQKDEPANLGVHTLWHMHL